MVPVSYLLYGLVGVLAFLTILVVAGLRFIGRKLTGSLGAEKQPIPAAPPPTLVDPQVIRVLSERLSVLEGRVPAMQATNDGYAALAIRVAEMEARLPTISDAYDKYSQMVLNADKRAADRDKRGRSRALSVEEAAAQMGLAGDPKAAVDEKKNASASLPGVMGSGGNVRRT